MASVNKTAKKDREGRVRIGARVAPRTLEFLESLGRPNMGRAIDAAVQLIVESGVDVTAGDLAHPDIPKRVF